MSSLKSPTTFTRHVVRQSLCSRPTSDRCGCPTSTQPACRGCRGGHLMNASQSSSPMPPSSSPLMVICPIWRCPPGAKDQRTLSRDTELFWKVCTSQRGCIAGLILPLAARYQCSRLIFVNICYSTEQSHQRKVQVAEKYLFDKQYIPLIVQQASEFIIEKKR